MTGRARNADDLRAEIGELFGELWQMPRLSGLRRSYRPQCDCIRTTDPPHAHIVLELPGARPESVQNGAFQAAHRAGRGRQ